jgi:hypothetical protein
MDTKTTAVACMKAQSTQDFFLNKEPAIKMKQWFIATLTEGRINVHSQPKARLIDITYENSGQQFREDNHCHVVETDDLLKIRGKGRKIRVKVRVYGKLKTYFRHDGTEGSTIILIKIEKFKHVRGKSK